MTLYTEKPKDTIRKLLELISEFTKFAGYRNPMHSFIVAIKNQKEKLKNQSQSPPK